MIANRSGEGSLSTEGRRILNGDLPTAVRIESAEGANHAAYVAAVQRLRPDVGAASEAIGGGVAAFAGIGDPLTQAFGLGLDGAPSEKELNRLFEFYTSRDAAVAVEVCNLADTALSNELLARGCRIDEHSHVLARTLSKDDSFASDDSVREVVPDDLDRWSEVLTIGFTEGEVHEPLMDVCRAFHAQENSACFGAWRDGRLVGGGCVFFLGDIALFGGTSTVPDARGKGVQRDLLQARLALALERGVRLAVVTTQPGTTSQRNTLRAGFSVIYARTRYVHERLR